MLCYPLLAKEGDGDSIKMPLPQIDVTTYWEKKSERVAVVFDIKHCPNKDFLPNFANKISSTNPLQFVKLRQDYLWESHCYEVFLAFGNSENSPYIEINFSPNGYFNIYHFEGYRKPEQMPPKRLAFADIELTQWFNVYSVMENQKPISWQTSLSSENGRGLIADLLAPRLSCDKDSHRLVMAVDIALLAKRFGVRLEGAIWLNACTVYKGEQNQTLAYFAPRHAMPPDFHAKKYWSKITPEGSHS